MEQEYFAKAKGDQIGNVLIAKCAMYNDGFTEHRYWDTIDRSYRLYYGIDHEATTGTKGLGKGGKRGELTKIKINKYRSNIQHLLSLLTQQRPAFDCRAVNSDPESQVQAELGNRILDYTLRNKHFDKFRREAVEYALVFGEGYMVLDWDVWAGEDYAVADDEQGDDEIKKAGDITFKVLTPFEVIKDTSVLRDEQEWYIFWYKVNKWDLVEQYTKGKRTKKNKELKEAIIDTSSQDNIIRYTESLYQWDDNIDSDKIWVYEFRHKKTPSMPYGRLVKFLSDGSVLSDSDLPFTEINVFTISPSHMFGTAFGYSPAFDIQGLQQGYDRLNSIVLSNNLAFGLHNIVVDNNANIQAQSIKGGLRFLRVNPDSRIQALQLNQPNTETYHLLERQEKDMAEGTGVNEAVKGQTPKGVTSGTALAYLGSAALQYLSGLDNSKINFEEGVMTSIINLYKDFGDTPRTLTLIGRNKKSYEQRFKGNDIIKINRVIVDSGNPLTKTLAGRIQTAEMFLQIGFIKNPSDFLQVIETGSLDSITEGFQKENQLIADENDRMLQGEEVESTLIDDHIQHIREHRGLLADYNIRQDPELLQPILDHIMGHIELYRELKTLSPEILLITQEGDLPGPQPQGLPGGGGEAGGLAALLGAAGAGGAGQGGAPAGPPGGPLGGAPGAGIPGPRQPSQPNNPLTGQPAQRSIPNAGGPSL